MLLLVFAAADLVVAAWLVAGWRRQLRHREFYLLVTTLLITFGLGLGTLAIT